MPVRRVLKIPLTDYVPVLQKIGPLGKERNFELEVNVLKECIQKRWQKLKSYGCVTPISVTM